MQNSCDGGFSLAGRFDLNLQLSQPNLQAQVRAVPDRSSVDLITIVLPVRHRHSV